MVYDAVENKTLVKVPQTPQNVFRLKKSTQFSWLLQWKIISIHKIPAFLQAFNRAISVFTTAQSGIWVGLLVTSLWGLG